MKAEESFAIQPEMGNGSALVGTQARPPLPVCGRCWQQANLVACAADALNIATLTQPAAPFRGGDVSCLIHNRCIHTLEYQRSQSAFQ